MTIIACIVLYLITALYSWDVMLRERRGVIIASKVLCAATAVVLVLFGSEFEVTFAQCLFMAALIMMCAADIIVYISAGYARAAVITVILAQLLLCAGMMDFLPVVWARLMLIPAAIVAMAHIFHWRRGCEQNDMHHHKRLASVFSVVAVVFLYSGLAGLFSADWLYSWSWIKPLLLAHGAILVYLSDSALGYGLFCATVRSKANAVLGTMLAQIGLLLLALGCVIDVSGFY